MKKEDYEAIQEQHEIIKYDLAKLIDLISLAMHKEEACGVLIGFDDPLAELNRRIQVRLEHYTTELAAPVVGDPKCPRCGSKNLRFLQHSGLFDCLDCPAVFERPSTGPESAT
jgi:hypothetical protein